MGGAHSRASAQRAAAANDVTRLQEIASAHPTALLRQSLWKQRSCLHIAARAGALEALCALLDVAAHRPTGSLVESLNAPDYAGDTALALACRSGYADCARELLEAGASPLPANAQGVSPLHYAAAHGHSACIHLLLTATVQLPDGSRCPAAQAPVRDVVDLERYIDTRTHGGLCALHLAVLCGSHAAVAELVNQGAQLDTPLLTVGFRAPGLSPPCLGAGSTALHMAAAGGRFQICVLILHAQQQRHPGLELRRMRNARGMTPLNIALACNHRNLASLLTAGAPVPAPPAPPRGRGPAGQLPPLLRQQLLALVHRAALLNQLRELGLGARAAAAAPLLPGLAAGPIARLEALLHSDAATAAQVLAVVDEMLDEAAAADTGGQRSQGAASGGVAAAGGSASGGSRASRRRERSRRRQQQEREAAAAQQLAATQAGVDWTLLQRSRSLWHAEHGGPSLYRRLHRRHERLRQAQPAGPSGAAAGAQQPEHALLLASALLNGGSLEQAGPSEHRQQRPGRDRGSPHGSSSGGGGGGSSGSGSSSEGPAAVAAPSPVATQGAAERREQQAGAGSQADSAVCPVCLDLPADICIAPCRHRACLGCCGRLAAYCASGSGGAFGLPATGPLCPLCRAPIESFLRTPG